MIIRKTKTNKVKKKVKRSWKLKLTAVLDDLKYRIGEPYIDLDEQGNLPNDLKSQYRRKIDDYWETVIRELSYLDDFDADDRDSFLALLRTRLQCSSYVVAYTLFEVVSDWESVNTISRIAKKKYLECHEIYEAVLGDFVAESLRKSVDVAVKEAKYQYGRNPTAATDWDFLMSSPSKSHDAVATPFPKLNQHLGGGISDITVVSGGEMAGKTTFCLQMLVHMLRSDPELGCLMFSLDMSKCRTLRRLWPISTGTPLSVLKKDQLHDSELDIQALVAKLKKDVLERTRIIEKANFSYDKPLTLEMIAEQHSKLVDASGVKRVIVLIDMFQSLSELCNIGNQNESDERCLSMLQRYIAWTKSSECPEGVTLLLVSEVRKNCREWSNDNLKGSSRIRSTPTNIIHLEELQGQAQKGPVVGRKLTIGKSRDGNAGEVIELDFHHRLGKFEERSQSTSKPNQTNSKRTKRRTPKASRR